MRISLLSHPNFSVIATRTAQRSSFVACRASSATTLGASLSLKLLDAAKSQDLLLTVELMAEARVEKALPSVSSEAIAAAVVTLAEARRGAKATEYLAILLEREGEAVPDEVLQSVWNSLKGESSSEAALLLYDKLVASGRPITADTCNRVTRIAARGGDVDRAMELLRRLEAGDFLIHRETYDMVAVALLKQGRGEEAEQVLEAKDYL